MAKIVVAGSYIQDLTFNTESFPKAGATVVGTFATGCGGKGFNQAVASNRLGIDTFFIGAVGQDAFASEAKNFAQKEINLSCALMDVNGVTTGTAAILVNNNSENMIVVSLGASKYLSADFVATNSKEFNGAKVVLCQLEANLQAMQCALEIGKQQNAITILNTAPINKELSPELLLLADIITPNETEMEFLLTHIANYSPTKPIIEMNDKELADCCEKLPASTIIITLGERGCFVSLKENSKFTSSVETRNFIVPPFKVSAVDTTGAGDAFSGGLAAGLVAFDNNLLKAVKFANATAALSVTKKGTAPAMPYKEDVKQMLL